MSESLLTKEIKAALAKKFSLTSARFATEVGCSSGRNDFGIVDFMTCKFSYSSFEKDGFAYLGIPIITCYEIKISINDFKSPNGHNLIGDKNYYVITDEIWKWVNAESFRINHYLNNGFIVYKNRKFYTKVESPFNEKPLSLEYRFSSIDSMMQRLLVHGDYHRSLIKEK
mgnify:CR=1 FL=1